VSDHEVAFNLKRAHQVAVTSALLDQIKSYMLDMPTCRVYISPFPPTAHFEHSSRSTVGSVIKGSSIPLACPDC